MISSNYPSNTEIARLTARMLLEVKAVHFNSSTIEALMESLYELNKKLLLREGRMLRLAVNEGVKRENFIEEYLNFNFEKKISRRWKKEW